MKKLLNFTRKLLLYIWFALTIIVALLLTIRIVNPGVKGISNYDLKTYIGITLFFAVIYFALKLIAKRNENNEAEQKMESGKMESGKLWRKMLWKKSILNRTFFS